MQTIKKKLSRLYSGKQRTEISTISNKRNFYESDSNDISEFCLGFSFRSWKMTFCVKAICKDLFYFIIYDPFNKIFTDIIFRLYFKSFPRSRHYIIAPLTVCNMILFIKMFGLLVWTNNIKFYF